MAKECTELKVNGKKRVS